MARKPNYGFERKERERIKAEKKARRTAEKEAAREKTSPAPGSSADDGAGGPENSSTE